MFKRRQLRQLFEGRTQESMAHGTDLAGYRRGCLAFVRDLHEALGVTLDDRGRAGYQYDADGQAKKPAGCAQAKELSLRALAESIMGHDVVEELYDPNPGASPDLGNRQLLEAAIDPASFVNISAFNLSVAGLINAEILELFDQPAFIGKDLVTVKDTSMNGQKLIGVTKLPKVDAASKGRKPGEAHAEIGLGEQYQTTPETIEQALKVRVTKEAVFFDLTGQVLEQAGAVGEELGYGLEKAIADEVMGTTNSHNWNGTSYNTYQAASPWINDFSNAFVDETSVDAARQLFVSMVDPATSKEILIKGLELLVMPAKELLVRQALFGPNVQIATQFNAGFPSRLVQSQPAVINTVGGGTYTLRPLSAIWYNRATAADGLALSAANAQKYWWIGDFKKAFWLMQNWPLTPWQAAADELVMKDQGLVSVHGANYRAVIYSKQPRYAVRSKN